jgi:hypothetical protein
MDDCSVYLAQPPGTGRGPPLPRHNPRHYGFAFGMTCRTMNPFPAGKYSRPPNPALTSELIFLQAELFSRPTQYARA